MNAKKKTTRKITRRRKPTPKAPPPPREVEVEEVEVLRFRVTQGDVSKAEAQLAHATTILDMKKAISSSQLEMIAKQYAEPGEVLVGFDMASRTLTFKPRE